MLLAKIFNKKLFIILACLLLIVGFVSFLKFKTIIFNNSIELSQGQIPITEIIVDSRVIHIDQNQTNQELFKKIYQLLGYQQRDFQFAIFGTYKFAKPKKIIFKFANIEDLNEQEKTQLFEPILNNKVYLRGTAINYDQQQQILTYTIYDSLNVYIVEKFSDELITQMWQKIIFRHLFVSSLTKAIEDKEEQQYLLLLDQFKLITKNKNLFTVKKTISTLINTWVSNLKQKLIPQVYAGYCSALHICGKSRPSWDCSMGGYAGDLECANYGDDCTDCCGPFVGGVKIGDCSHTYPCEECDRENCGENQCNQANKDSCTGTSCPPSMCALTNCNWHETGGGGGGATPPPSCGDGTCGTDENCDICPLDCGTCPPPVPTPDPCEGVNCNWSCCTGSPWGQNLPYTCNKWCSPGVTEGCQICRDSRCGPPTNCDNPSPPDPPCPSLSSPLNLAASCDYSGASPIMTLSWSAVADADYYPLRVDANPSSFNTACTPANPGDFCGNVTGTTYQVTTDGGTVYGWWVHAENSCGNISGANSQTMGCAGCPSNVTVTCGNPTFSPSYIGGIGVQATVTWTSAPAGVDQYIVRLDNDPTNSAQCLNLNGDPVNWFCAGYDRFLTAYDANSFEGAETNTLNTYVLPNVDYTAKVQSKFSTLDSAYSGTGCETSPITFSCPFTDIQGMVYVDDGTASLAGNRCVNGGTALPVTNFEAFDIYDPFGTVHTNTVTNHFFSETIPDMPFIKTTDLNKNTVNLHINNAVGGETAYACACPNSGSRYDCTYYDVLSPELDVNFFVQAYDISNPAWFQTFGSNIYANSNISSLIPQQCIDDPTCGSALNLPDQYNTVNSPGFPFQLTGSLQTFETAGESYIHKDPTLRTNAFGANSRDIKLGQYKYSYYLNKINSSGATVESISAETDLQGARVSDGNLHVLKTSSSGLTISNVAITVKNNTKVVVLVDGDLNIDNPNGMGHLITVEQGSYLAFVVKQAMNIAPEVGYPLASYVPYDGTIATSTPNLEGVYIVDGIINVESFGATGAQDRKFVGAGTFVGWGGVNLQRNFGNNISDPVSQADNNLNATEVFYYRPDLVINAPNIMRETFQSWQLSAPVWQE